MEWRDGNPEIERYEKRIKALEVKLYKETNASASLACKILRHEDREKELESENEQLRRKCDERGEKMERQDVQIGNALEFYAPLTEDLVDIVGGATPTFTRARRTIENMAEEIQCLKEQIEGLQRKCDERGERMKGMYRRLVIGDLPLWLTIQEWFDEDGKVK